MLYGLVALAFLAFWVYCVLDVVAAEESLVRALPRTLWLLLVLLVPTIGGAAWLFLGRPEGAAPPRGDSGRRAPAPRSRASHPIGPDDSEEFLRRLDRSRHPSARGSETDRLQAWEADLRRREDDLRRREDGD